MNWGVFLLIVALAFMALVCYSCCVIAGRSDERAKEMYEEMFPCSTCKHRNESWASEACDGCCGAHSNYEAEGSEINGETIQSADE